MQAWSRTPKGRALSRCHCAPRYPFASRTLLLAVSCVTGALTLAVALAFAGQSYLTGLGSLPGGLASDTRRISSNGAVVVGENVDSYMNSTRERAARWTQG